MAALDRSWLVHKFGGSSVASAACFSKVKGIIEQHIAAPNRRLAIVVSAMGGSPKVTDLLLNSVAAAAARDDAEIARLLQSIRAKHQTALKDLAMLTAETRDAIAQRIDADLDDVRRASPP